MWGMDLSFVPRPSSYTPPTKVLKPLLVMVLSLRWQEIICSIVESVITQESAYRQLPIACAGKHYMVTRPIPKNVLIQFPLRQ